jgi:hypothetical protein
MLVQWESPRNGTVYMAEHGITKTSSSSILTSFLSYCRKDINVVNIYTYFFFFFLLHRRLIVYLV